jgi:hypothetical protein
MIKTTDPTTLYEQAKHIAGQMPMTDTDDVLLRTVIETGMPDGIVIQMDPLGTRFLRIVATGVHVLDRHENVIRTISPDPEQFLLACALHLAQHQEVFGHSEWWS